MSAAGLFVRRMQASWLKNMFGCGGAKGFVSLFFRIRIFFGYKIRDNSLYKLKAALQISFVAC